jgi:hypothetical protein
MKKIKVGVNAMSVRMKRLGYRGGGGGGGWGSGPSHVPPPPVQEKQGSVLTNQCLGKKEMLSEELRNHGQGQTYSSETWSQNAAS